MRSRPWLRKRKKFENPEKDQDRRSHTTSRAWKNGILAGKRRGGLSASRGLPALEHLRPSPEVGGTKRLRNTDCRPA